MNELPTYNVPAMAVSVQLIGSELNPVIVVDNFFASPKALLDLATEKPDFVAQTTDFYPGLRKNIIGSYSREMLTSLEPVIKDVFTLAEETRAKVSLCAFSLTTTPTHKLRPIQCVPHIDTHDPNQFAVVHYLCDERYGGTAFYRHRSTGFESISEERLRDYFRVLKQEVVGGGLPELDYIRGNTNLFEQIASFDIRFNRALIYRSSALHSGNVNECLGLSANPRLGRLTANSFIHFATPSSPIDPF